MHAFPLPFVADASQVNFTSSPTDDSESSRASVIAVKNVKISRGRRRHTSESDERLAVDPKVLSAVGVREYRGGQDTHSSSSRVSCVNVSSGVSLSSEVIDDERNADKAQQWSASLSSASLKQRLKLIGSDTHMQRRKADRHLEPKDVKKHDHRPESEQRSSTRPSSGTVFTGSRASSSSKLPADTPKPSFEDLLSNCPKLTNEQVESTAASLRAAGFTCTRFLEIAQSAEPGYFYVIMSAAGIKVAITYEILSMCKKLYPDKKQADVH